MTENEDFVDAALKRGSSTVPPPGYFIATQVKGVKGSIRTRRPL